MAKVLKIFLLLFLLLSLSATFYYANQVVNLSSRASFTSTDLSTENSYVFASPVTAKSDGQETIRITIFILSEQGLAIPSVPIDLVISRSTVKITPISPTTDESGKAYFELSSIMPGPVTVVAKTDNSEINQKLTVSFY